MKKMVFLFKRRLVRLTESFPICLLLLLLLSSITTTAQDEEGPIDPLLGNRNIASSDEVILLFPDFTNTGGGYYHHRLYDYASLNNPDLDNELLFMTKDSITGQRPVQEILDALSEDMDGDGFDEIVSTWLGENDQSLRIDIRQVDSNDYSFSSAVSVFPLLENELMAQNTMVRPVPGNFDKDAEKELVLSYLNHDSVKIIILDSDGTLSPKRKTSIQDEIIYNNNSEINYDITTGDFDGDGTDEIVFVGGARSSVYNSDEDKMINKESMFLKVYEVDMDDEYEITAQVKEEGIEIADDKMQDQPYNYRLNGLRISAVDFDNNAIDEIVIGSQVFYDDAYFVLQTFLVSQNLDSISYKKTGKYIHRDVFEDRGSSMTITTGDLTGDGNEEVVFAAWDKLGVYKADSGIYLSELAELSVLNISGSFSGDRNNRTIVVSDLDASLSQNAWQQEIVITNKQSVGEFSETVLEILVYEAVMDISGELKLLRKVGYQDLSIDIPSVSPFAIVSGNFEGDGMRLGKPNQYKETNIFQPLVVLNAPPVHFDVSGNSIFDISNCFSGGDCNFIATYEEGLTLTEQISTQVTSDWGIDGKVYSNFEVSGNKLNSYMKTNYGENFSQVENSSQTLTVGVEVQAIHDDLIYATVGDYTIWEYPIYNDGIFQGYLTTVVPELVENRWFPSKSQSGNNYLPSHEVGNILSYSNFIKLPEISAKNETIKGIENNNYALGPSTSYEWRLEFSDFKENSASQTRKTGIEMGVDAAVGRAESISVSAEPFGVGVSSSVDFKAQIGLEIIGDYNTENFSSHTTTVKEDLLLKVNMGATTNSETGYQVTPYAFWSNSGTLVIDYAVDVDISALGYTPTWWQQQYGSLPDPALILPWRNDPEKGYHLVSDVKRQQTKDIVISQKDPQPGDTILIFARIHNFSLLPTTAPVNVSFYHGDPAIGGALIESNDGQTIITTETALAERSFQWVHMEWIMPESGRLYIVLDPENSMDEIHENNNIGWIALGAFKGEDETNKLFTALHDIQDKSSAGQLTNYPNPFREYTNIAYSIDNPQFVRIRIIDLAGREVFRQDEGLQFAGEHLIEFNGSELTEGVYILSLEMESGTFSNKMILIK